MIYLDAGDNLFRGEQFNEILTRGRGLMGGFFEKNDAIDIIGEIRGGEENVTISATVLGGIRDV